MMNSDRWDVLKMLREKRRGVSALVITLLAMGMVTGLICLYRRENGHIRVRSQSEFTEGAADEIVYSIEEEGISSSGDYRLHGWFVRKGQVYSFLNAGMMEAGSGVYNNNHLCYVKNDLVYELPTKLEYRKDVNRTLHDGIDYEYSGFYARVPEEDVGNMNDAELGMIAKTPDGEEILYLLK